MVNLKVAVLQLNPRIGRVSANIDNATRVLQSHGFLLNGRPTGRKLDILVLPELAFTGYNFSSTDHIKPYLEPTTSGPSTQWAQDISKKLGCFTLVGYPELHEPTQCIYNSAVMTNATGSVIANYRKTFLYETDEKWGCSEPPVNNFSDGGMFPLTTVSAGGLNTQVGICMDLNPYKFERPFDDYEFANAAIKNKARLILCPTAWLHPDSPDIDNTLAVGEEKSQALARLLAEQEEGLAKQPSMLTVQYWLQRMFPFLEGKALDDKPVLFALCNRFGAEDNTVYAGSSSIFELNSRNEKKFRYFGSLGQATEDLLYAEVDLD